MGDAVLLNQHHQSFIDEAVAVLAEINEIDGDAEPVDMPMMIDAFHDLLSGNFDAEDLAAVYAYRFAMRRNGADQDG